MTSQLCPQIPAVSFTAHGECSVFVEFAGNRNGCSDIIAHIFFDGAEWGSNRVGPGQKDGGYDVPRLLAHHDAVSIADGRVDHCLGAGASSGE